MPAPSAITLHDLSFSWPDGTVALSHLSGTFSSGTTGLVGRNGSGKSTLLRLISAELSPTGGHIDTLGSVGYLPQNLTLTTSTTVAELLGIGPVLSALRAIEAGSIAEEDFEAVGNHWDIEARAEESLARIGFSVSDLDRSVSELSGGEAMLIAVTGLQLAGTAITLLDEPTNNLDRPTRARLAALVDHWPGTLIVVSHDLELLERMDNTAEIYAGELSVFGGPYSAWKAALDHEQDAATQAARNAKAALKVEKRQKIEAEIKLARRERTAKKAARESGLPKIMQNYLKNASEGSAAGMRKTIASRVASAQETMDDADARVRQDTHISVDLPDPGVAKSRRIAEITSGDRTLIIQGPERVAIVGPNGSGKTTLLRAMMGDDVHTVSIGAEGRLLTDRIGYLPQRLDGLDDGTSAIDNVRAAAPEATPGVIRNHLARLLLRGGAADRPVGTLSGGERFRVALARLLYAEPPAQILILDEPTNNLDIESVEQLAEALDAYRGALLVVSHDYSFLERIHIDTWLEFGTDGVLREGAGTER